MHSEIAALVERFVAGDDSAFAELVARYERKVYQVAFQIVRNHYDADEVVQETFVRIFKRRNELGKVSSFTSFLLRVATNYAIDLHRRQRSHDRWPEEDTPAMAQLQTILSADVRTPGDDFRDRRLMVEIIRALDTLPPRQRLTAILHDVQGYSKREVAEILECPEATVRSNLHIARTKLKKILRKRLRTEE